MKHRNLKDEKWTRTAIDSLFDRGMRADWEEFASALREDKQLALDTLYMCEHHSNTGSAALAEVLLRHFYGKSKDMGLK
ncbi:MAG: hypothetical protein IT174_06070 [Acidobacteria bacterium]|nr:hypothetical protein [Acidobacteriota bacterium]